MSGSDALRVVFDCVVFLQAIARPDGPAARLLVDCVEAGRITLFVSDEILDELRDVLARPRIRSKNPAITDLAVDAFCERVLKISTRIDPVPAVFSLPRDPDDEPYLNLTIASKAEYLVTRDKDLLDLMSDEDFRSSHAPITILDPVALLRILDPGRA